MNSTDTNVAALRAQGATTTRTAAPRPAADSAAAEPAPATSADLVSLGYDEHDPATAGSALRQQAIKMPAGDLLAVGLAQASGMNDVAISVKANGIPFVRYTIDGDGQIKGSAGKQRFAIDPYEHVNDNDRGLFFGDSPAGAVAMRVHEGDDDSLSTQGRIGNVDMKQKVTINEDDESIRIRSTVNGAKYRLDVKPSKDGKALEGNGKLGDEDVKVRVEQRGEHAFVVYEQIGQNQFETTIRERR
jgi:hypothetical protein